MKYDSIASAYTKIHEMGSSQALYEEVLVENRLEYLKANTPVIDTAHDTFATHRKAADVIDFLAKEADPTPNKVHTQWLLNMYKKGEFKQEDTGQLNDLLKNYDSTKSRLPLEKRNVANIKTVREMKDLVSPHVNTADTKLERKLADAPSIKGFDKKYEDDKIRVNELDNKDTAKKLFGDASNTWCFASKHEDRNQWDNYRGTGKIHIVTRKDNGRNFAYHVNSGEFMDDTNSPVSKPDLDEILPSLHKAWDKDPELLK